jgi:hypothetical protein
MSDVQSRPLGDLVELYRFAHDQDKRRAIGQEIRQRLALLEEIAEQVPMVRAVMKGSMRSAA